MISLLRNQQRGFTLIEIIITLVVAGVLGSTMFQYLGTSYTQSSVPISRLTRDFELQKVIENISADYKEDYDLINLKTEIGVAASNPHNNDYGTYNVIYNDYIKFVEPVPGSGDFVEEDELVVGIDPEDLLKVTIGNDFGQTVTALFIFIGTDPPLHVGP